MPLEHKLSRSLRVCAKMCVCLEMLGDHTHTPSHTHTHMHARTRARTRTRTHTHTHTQTDTRNGGEGASERARRALGSGGRGRSFSSESSAAGRNGMFGTFGPFGSFSCRRRGGGRAARCRFARISARHARAAAVSLRKSPEVSGSKPCLIAVFGAHFGTQEGTQGVLGRSNGVLAVLHRGTHSLNHARTHARTGATASTRSAPTHASCCSSSLHSRSGESPLCTP